MKKLLLAAMCVSLFFSCGGNGNGKAGAEVVTNPATAANPDEAASEAPILTFSENIHNFGQLKEGEVVSYKFKFTNTGKTDLIISGASASCGCTVPSYPKQPIAPGGEGAIDVQFNSTGKVGIIDKQITITANTIPNQVYLVIKGEVLENKK